MNYRQGLGSSVSVEVLDTNLKDIEHIENLSKKSEKAIEIKKKILDLKQNYVSHLQHETIDFKIIS